MTAGTVFHRTRVPLPRPRRGPSAFPGGTPAGPGGEVLRRHVRQVAAGHGQLPCTSWSGAPSRNRSYERRGFLPPGSNEHLPPETPNLWRRWPYDAAPEACDLYLAPVRRMVWCENALNAGHLSESADA